MDKTMFENIAVDALCKKGYDMARRLDMGFSPTGCEEQSLSVAVLLYHCSCNNVMFSEDKFDIMNNILNSI